jgi:hypothetical protein
VNFVHEDPQFDELLRVVADRRRLALALIEKDYWVTHVLWALHEQGFDVWFKGGTSLAKGFGLIERFSEDLDLKVEPGRQERMPRVGSWKSESTKATSERRATFAWLAANLRVHGATVRLDAARSEAHAWRTADIQVLYPSPHRATLPSSMRPYVLLEVGSARVVPFVARDLTSFVHDHLGDVGLASDFNDNRPHAVRCVHPLVTLLEKLDALGRRAPRDDVDPAIYVRHYEDAARIVRAFGSLPPLRESRNVRALADEMRGQHQLARVPFADDPAFDPSRLMHGHRIRDAHEAVGPMYWGPRLSLDEACEVIRAWVRAQLG